MVNLGLEASRLANENFVDSGFCERNRCDQLLLILHGVTMTPTRQSAC